MGLSSMANAQRPLLILQLLPCFLLLHWYTALAWNVAPLTPPPGNSIQLKASILKSFQFYRCTDGDWLLESAHAVLVDSANNHQVLGNYSYIKRPRQPKYAGTWFLINSEGDTAESGSAVSLVAGRKIEAASAGHGNSANFLAEASKHRFTGTASLISYIARMNTRGGLPPADGYCDEDMVAKVPYQAEYHFWKQDLVPPSVPQPLTLPTDRAVQGFFGKGVIAYIFDGKDWRRKNIVAKLYDLPGGNEVGSYYIMPTPDSKGGNYRWEVNNPNGFQIVGKNAGNQVNVSPGCLPWSVDIITTYSGNVSLLGPYTHVQTVSTRGGLPPAALSFKPTADQRLKEAFSAIFWLYSSS